MIFEIEIASSNQECIDAPRSVIVRSMHKIQNEIAEGKSSGKILDINGNTIGKWKYSEKWTKCRSKGD